jgi:hypothetical protein
MQAVLGGKMNSIIRIICGTSKTSPSEIYTGGRKYDLTTHSGALRWRVRCLIGRIRDYPRNVRWRLANRLSRLAMRLRGDKTIEGFHCIQNRAADLEDSIFHPLICVGDSVTLTKDECDDIIEAAHKLGKIANATTYVDYWKASK